MERLVIIDGNHLIHRAFHAIQSPLKTSWGEQTNALYGFGSMLLNILDAEKPDYLALTFDEKAPTFRHDEHEGYKATRAKAPDELHAQIPRVREMMQALQVPIFSQEGFEADDLIGTLATHAKKKGLMVFIVTGDRDALQLINDHVFVVFPHKGYKDPEVMDRQKVIHKFGVTPEQIVDYKALMGDSSDNIKGVEGIGPKNAVKLLQEYGSLDGIYAHLDEINGGNYDKLASGRDAAYFSQRMARIVCDVPIDFDSEKTRVSKLDFAGLKRFFETMEMRSLAKRLQSFINEKAPLSSGQMSLF